MTEKGQLRRLKAFVNEVIRNSDRIMINSSHIRQLAISHGIATPDNFGVTKADWLNDENKYKNFTTIRFPFSESN